VLKFNRLLEDYYSESNVFQEPPLRNGLAIHEPSSQSF